MNAKYAFIDSNSGFLFFVKRANAPIDALEAGLADIGETPEAAERSGQHSYFTCYDVSDLDGVENFDGQDEAAISAVENCKWVGEYVAVRA